MAPKKSRSSDVMGKKIAVNKGAWTADEDRKLSYYIQQNGAKHWKTVPIKAGVNRCGKSCRLRWLNYLRPNIKRGNISKEEEDLILRLHKLLGNRWSLIAGRLPGRTDNEIKNYWNSHLSKKVNHEGQKAEFLAPLPLPPTITSPSEEFGKLTEETVNYEETVTYEASEINIEMKELFDFSTEGTYGLEWIDKFLKTDEQGL